MRRRRRRKQTTTGAQNGEVEQEKTRQEIKKIFGEGKTRWGRSRKLAKRARDQLKGFDGIYGIWSELGTDIPDEERRRTKKERRRRRGREQSKTRNENTKLLYLVEKEGRDSRRWRLDTVSRGVCSWPGLLYRRRKDLASHSFFRLRLVGWRINARFFFFHLLLLLLPSAKDGSAFWKKRNLPTKSSLRAGILKKT